MDSHYGKIIADVNGLDVGSDEVEITFEDGTIFWMKHYQDCCESVCIVDIDSATENLIGATWHGYTERSEEGESRYGSATWTFYTLETSRGYVWIRWLGESNGYYSEGVSHGYREVGEPASRW